jgi:uncharacterized protein
MSSATTVVRPIVRSFAARFTKEAARHVKAGGHAVVWSESERATLVFTRPKRGDVHDLGLWSVLDLGKSRWGVAKDGPLKGLATLRIPDDSSDIVRRRAERDSIFPGPTRTLELDCLACGACCKDNEVVLMNKDVARFQRAGLSKLLKKPWSRTKGGRVVLTLKKNGRCHHLGRDNKCGVYEHRPAACSEFPAGSECCLFSREEELGITDGAKDSRS